MPKLALLLTGNELMTGDTVDSNSAMMAEPLLSQGLHIDYKVTVGDDLNVLVSEMQRLSREFDVLIINGGLGPTTDDLTAEALSMAMGVPLNEHPDAIFHLERWCKQRNFELNEPNRKQALLPQSIEIIPNSVGSAVGFKTDLNECLVYCTPGVPRELKAMMEEEVLPELLQRYPLKGHPKRYRLRVFGMGEASLQKRISDDFPNWPVEIELGYRASMPLLELKLKVNDSSHHDLLETWRGNMHSVLGEHIVTEDERSLATVVLDLLVEKNKRVTTAESCTGGLIASSITEVAGSSAVFDAGYVTYANSAKSAMLGVSESSLNEQGAVSESVVRQMLLGALNNSGADLGVAVSGIAGPSGGTKDKPVGTVWIAWGSREKIKSEVLYLPGQRVYFQKMVAFIALDLIRRELLASKEEPAYLKERRLNRAR